MADATARQLRLKIDAGGEQVEVLRFEGSEGLSRHFELIVDVLAPLGEVDWLPHLGKPGIVTLHEDGQRMRDFHGIVVNAVLTGEDEAGFEYRLTMRPCAWFHEQGRSFRIFQQKTVRDILQTTFGRCTIPADFEKLEGGTRLRSYCVQYGESDFAFACRLMEEEGIYYYYTHSSTGHILTLCSSSSAHKVGDASPLRFNPSTLSVVNTDSAARSTVHIGLFMQTWHEQVSTGAEALVTMRDFDFMKPGRSIETSASGPGQHRADAVEVYQYPGRYYDSDQGKALSETTLTARRAERRTYSGVSKLGSIAVGRTMKLTEHPIGRFNDSYLVTRTHHLYHSESYRSGTAEAGAYEVRLDAIPASVTWKAPQITPRPFVAGPETAIVTGPAGEEIHVDKYGRVRIQFHWDRDGHYDDHSSCWVRVSQTGGLGNIILPRVGHEVLVDFINGDPDRPIVVGRVFNQNHMPTYTLPENKTRAVWRTKRYGAEGAYSDTENLDCQPVGVNEIRLEDKGGAEEVFIYAERDLNTRVRHAETHHVGNDQEIKVGHDRMRKVKQHETIEIGKNRKVEIGDTDTLTIKNKLTTEVQSGDEIRKISKDQTITVGKKISIEAGDEIKLKVGESVITMTKKKITIEGGQIEITGTMTVKTSAPAITAEASGAHTIKGTVVKIN